MPGAYDARMPLETLRDVENLNHFHDERRQNNTQKNRSQYATDDQTKIDKSHNLNQSKTHLIPKPRFTHNNPISSALCNSAFVKVPIQLTTAADRAVMATGYIVLEIPNETAWGLSLFCGSP